MTFERSLLNDKKIKPDLITLNEGILPEYINEIFDMNYAYKWNNEYKKVPDRCRQRLVYPYRINGEKGQFYGE